MHKFASGVESDKGDFEGMMQKELQKEAFVKHGKQGKHLKEAHTGYTLIKRDKRGKERKHREAFKILLL